MKKGYKPNELVNKWNSLRCRWIHIDSHVWTYPQTEKAVINERKMKKKIQAK